MTFRVGDIVLWWGEPGTVTDTEPSPGALVFFTLNETCEEMMIGAVDLLAHQRPWRYDKALRGWVPDDAAQSLSLAA